MVRALALLLFVLVVSAGCTTKALPAGSVVIDRVDVVGAEKVDGDDVEDKIATAETKRALWGSLEGVPILTIFDAMLVEYRTYDQLVLERDLQRVRRFYQARGFYEAQVRAGRVVPTEGRHVRVEIVVDEGEQPCAATDLEEEDSCAGVTHSPLDASPSFITLATHQPIAAVTTTAAPAPTTGATTPPTDSPPAPEEVADEDDSSTPWGLVAGLGGGLVLIGLGVTRFFGSSSSSGSPSESPSGGPPATIVTVPPPTSTESEPQVCRVEVQANEINGLGIYHLCLIFTDEHGARYFRGGPGETTLKDGLLGRVTGHTGKHVPGAVDWEPGCPTVLIAEGPDVCAKKELLFDELSRINRMGAAYELEGPNSNTTVRRLLRAAGLPEEKPDVLTPGWDHDGLDPKPPKPTGPGPKPAPAPVPKTPTPPPAGGPGR